MESSAGWLHSVPSSLCPPRSALSLLRCSEPCCPGWNLEPVSKLAFLTWQRMMRLVGNLPYPFFVKHQSWCLTLNPGRSREGEMQGRTEISAGWICAFLWCDCLGLVFSSGSDRMAKILVFFPFVFLVISMTCKWKFFSSLFVSGKGCIKEKSSV